MSTWFCLNWRLEIWRNCIFIYDSSSNPPNLVQLGWQKEISSLSLSVVRCWMEWALLRGIPECLKKTGVCVCVCSSQKRGGKLYKNQSNSLKSTILAWLEAVKCQLLMHCSCLSLLMGSSATRNRLVLTTLCFDLGGGAPFFKESKKFGPAIEGEDKFIISACYPFSHSLYLTV